MRKTINLIVMLCCVFLVACSSVQEKAPSNEDVKNVVYTLGAGDNIFISVFEEENMQLHFRIHQGGKINFPYIGEVECEGRTAREIGVDIEARLKDGIINRPIVTVTIERFRNFYIGGEVEMPGKYEFEPNLTVEKAIMISGGVTDRGDDTDVNVRDAQTGKLIENVEATYPIKPGDAIYIEMSFF